MMILPLFFLPVYLILSRVYCSRSVGCSSSLLLFLFIWFYMFLYHSTIFCVHLFSSFPNVHQEAAGCLAAKGREGGQFSLIELHDAIGFSHLATKGHKIVELEHTTMSTTLAMTLPGTAVYMHRPVCTTVFCDPASSWIWAGQRAGWAGSFFMLGLGIFR